MRRILVIGVMMCGVLFGQAQTQLCNGSLGENIFTDGDFGSGSSNLVLNDPNFAPGYIYTTNMPIGDGYYTLTNDMGQWQNLYETWLEIGDNSADPNGYMMVVNASFSPGIFFDRVVEDLCENTEYEFSADVINVIKRETSGHILPNVSFFIDGDLRYSTGAIGQTEEWQTVGFTFKTGPGQESAQLTMRNNAPGGIGNDIAIDNISFRACGPPSEVTTNTPGVICEDATFPTLSADIQDTTTSFMQWQISSDNGMTWEDIPGGTTPTFSVGPVPPGNYLYRFIHATSPANLANEKCRVVSDFLALEVVPLEYLIVDTICAGLSYPLGNEEFSQEGIYERTFTSSIGCDSIVTLDLTIWDDPGIVPVVNADGPGCYEGVDGYLVLDSVIDGVPPFEIALENGPLLPIDSLVLPSGSYTLTVSDRYGCSDVSSYAVPVTPEFMLWGLMDTTITLGHQIPLNVQTNYPVSFVQWTPSTGLSCDDCLETLAGPFNNIAYDVYAISINGCEASTGVSVDVDRTVKAYFPNVFSPNYDGVNDYWGIIADIQNVRLVKEVAIFDRWGATAVSRTDVPIEEAAKLWDGEIGGQLAGPGVYTYMAILEMPDGTIEKRSGTITVLR